MATASVSREASPSETYVQRRFAELGARMQRVELWSQLLLLALVPISYACLIGWFDYAIGVTTAIRWIGFAVFASAMIAAVVYLIRRGTCRVNPYYVAHQLEHHLPESKNSLINWLDLHDEPLPGAFQKNLSARAADQLRDANPELALRQRKQWVLLGIASVPMAGLFVLFVLGPAAFFLSMLQAFVPFYTPTHAARTQITLLEPQAGDAEVSPLAAVAFTVRIEGRVPSGHQPDAPKLHYRYQASEDFLTSPLQRDADGNWTTQLAPTQLRTGLSYKISAGDAETPLHQINVRGRLHAAKFEVTYRYRPYRQLPPATKTFTNKPQVHGMPGTEVELIVRANRAVQAATIEIRANGVKKEVPTRPIKDDSRAFTCRWTLEQSAQFRVLFHAADGEANADRDWHPIDIRSDAAPTVILTTPGKDVTLPENGTITLEGRASDDVGIKKLALHLRSAEAPGLVPIVYPLVQLDGADPREIDYMEVVALDQLKNAQGTTILLRAGTTIEYWLEATDNADYPDPKGNLGKSTVYKVVLTPAPKDAKAQQAQKKQRDQDQAQKQQHQKDQQKKQEQQQKDKQANPDGGGSGQNDAQKQADQTRQQNQDVENKIDNAQKQGGHGGAKGGDPQSGASKDSPPPEPDGAKPQEKSQPPISPDDAGKSKEQGEQGDAKNQSGESKDGGGEQKKKSADSKGERKDGPSDNSSAAKGDGPTKMDDGPGTSKDAGMMGADGPPQPTPKNDKGDAGAPMPNAKGSTPPANEPHVGEPKGVEQNGPELGNKDAPTGANPPPDGQAKSGKMADGGEPKGEPKQGDGDPGQARDNERSIDAKNPDLRDLAKKLEQLEKDDANADQVGKEFADLAVNADDPRIKELAKEILDKNGRDAKTGTKKKGPNRFGSNGKSDGIGDDIKTTIANREFAARIGQMQLDDWKKRLTPDLLKRAGLTDADWQRFLKNRARYDALVRQLNAKLIRDNVKERRTDGSQRPSVGPTAVQSVGPNGERLNAGNTSAPPELIEAERRLFSRQNSP